MYAAELNAVLHKSVCQPQKDYPYICLFFFKRFSFNVSHGLNLIWCFKECGLGTGCLTFNTVYRFNEKLLKTCFGFFLLA